MGSKHTLRSPHPFPPGPKSRPTQTVPPTISNQVLKTCAPAPAVLEVLFNSYSQLRVSESWKEVIPEEVFQVRKLPLLSPLVQDCCLFSVHPRVEFCANTQVSGKHLEKGRERQIGGISEHVCFSSGGSVITQPVVLIGVLWAARSTKPTHTGLRSSGLQ